MILWRAIALGSLLIALCVCADTLRHDSFDSGFVGSTSLPHYFVRCEGLEFESDVTIAKVRVLDDSPLPQFVSFKQALSRGPAPFLIVPAMYGSSGGELHFVSFEQFPDVASSPKPDNEVHEAVLTIALEPLSKIGIDPLKVNRVYLGFPGLRPFGVERRVPLPQSQDTLADVHNSIVQNISPSMARIFLPIAALACCGIIADVYWERNKLAARWRRKSTTAKGELVAQQKDKSNALEGEFLVPAKWDERAIAVQLRNLQNRPALLNVFAGSLKDRYILNQDHKTAKIRIDYLNTKLEELKISKQLQGELDQLQFRETDLEIRRMEQEVRKGDLQHELNSRPALRTAENKRDILRVKAESAQFEKQIREAKGSPSPAGPSPTANPRVQELRDRIQRAKEQRAYARETATDPDERKLNENLYDDRIAQLEEELSSLT